MSCNNEIRGLFPGRTDVQSGQVFGLDAFDSSLGAKGPSVQ